MAGNRDHRAADLETENTGGFLTGFLAEEDEFDRRALWRLGSWGAVSVGAVIAALLANQSSLGFRREQVASADLARQTQQVQSVAKESLTETRRLASAIDTLNGDRDRLYSRVTVLEQGLDSVTGAIARQSFVAASQAAAAPSGTVEPPAASQNPARAPVLAPVATTSAAPAEKPSAPAAAEPDPAPVSSVEQASATPPSPPLMASKSLMAPPDSAAAKLIEPEARASDVSAWPMPDVVATMPSANGADLDASEPASRKVTVQRTEFGVDVGGANSIDGLRALWRGLKSSKALATLRPIIMFKEAKGGPGMQLRLVAGPLNDAGAAAKICAALIESKRTCETAVFDGQTLAMKADEPPAAAKPPPRRRPVAKRAANDEPPKKTDSSIVSGLFGKR